MGEMKRNGGGLVSCLLCVAGVAACFLPRPAGAAGSPRQPADPAGHHGGLSPLSAPAPAPTTGADDELPPVSPRAPEQTPPHFGFPLEPTVGLAAPPPAAGAPSAGEGYPFIGSNPTVPLPTGVTDTSTVLPVPDRGDGNGDGKVVGRAPAVRAQIAMTIGILSLIVSVVLPSSSS